MKASTKKARSARAKKEFCVMCPDWEIKIPERCSNTLKRGAKTLYFCTRRCKDRFLRA